ncbi:MAG TPA: GDP-mannose 4,6-dehydratase [Pirellulales bacterium]|nr:GDP-mannose 4,6-dehydratase [Pirellulales bacterium]
MSHILITGGAGFIGSHLAEALLARGELVTVIDNQSTGTVKNLAPIERHPHFAFVPGSVADRELVAKYVGQADVVYHLAAAVGVQLIASNPIHTIETNVYPTEILLAELRRQHEQGRDVKLFLASTSEVYGKNPKPSWSEEDDLVFGSTTRARWSYGVSKAIDEFLALAHWREQGLPLVIARFFNVVGLRQTGSYGMVLPRFVDAALAGRPLTVHDDGRQVRCFAHVTDVVESVLALMHTPAALGRVFNVGSDQPVSILELAQRVVQAVDPQLPIEFQSYAEAYSPDFEDVRSRVPDLSRLRETIEYRPRHTLDDAIREVVAWKRSQQ